MATVTETSTQQREFMNLVIVGHVDHGKSTVIGRLLADTGSLPEGKLEQVRATCERNARPFEYAFLLDALKAEQAQGITIDTARCFFKTERRNYIINDAPGHIEFLKNMVTGAARAEAALLVIDAAEGIQENSKRHGYLLSLLGFRQLAVLVNKMDLVEFNEERFNAIRTEYLQFLNRLGVHPQAFIPISAREGMNIAQHAEEMPWYTGPSVLEQIDAFEHLAPPENAVFRMPVQDIYKFTQGGDDRRIVAGTIASGSIRVGTNVIFLPSGKESTIKSIEGFNTPPRDEIGAGYATGFQLTTQIYIKPGELMCKVSDPRPHVGTRFHATLFWMGRAPLVKGKRYKLKIGAQNVAMQLAEIRSVLDATELASTAGKPQIERHDVAECIFETERPIAFDRRNDIEQTGRFVIVDDNDIAGAAYSGARDISGITLPEGVRRREFSWESGAVTPEMRRARFNNRQVHSFQRRPGHRQARSVARAGAPALGTRLRHLLFRHRQPVRGSRHGCAHALDGARRARREARSAGACHDRRRAAVHHDDRRAGCLRSGTAARAEPAQRAVHRQYRRQRARPGNGQPAAAGPPADRFDSPADRDAADRAADHLVGLRHLTMLSNRPVRMS